jgi:hypothetical protein
MSTTTFPPTDWLLHSRNRDQHLLTNMAQIWGVVMRPGGPWRVGGLEKRGRDLLAILRIRVN